jgi:two-component system chemotaxis response regulator CheY
MSGVELSKILKVRCTDSVLVLAIANIQKSVRDAAEEIGIGILGKPITAEKILPFLNEHNL